MNKRYVIAYGKVYDSIAECGRSLGYKPSEIRKIIELGNKNFKYAKRSKLIDAEFINGEKKTYPNVASLAEDVNVSVGCVYRMLNDFSSPSLESRIKKVRYKQ